MKKGKGAGSIEGVCIVGAGRDVNIGKGWVAGVWGGPFNVRGGQGG